MDYKEELRGLVRQYMGRIEALERELWPVGCYTKQNSATISEPKDREELYKIHLRERDTLIQMINSIEGILSGSSEESGSQEESSGEEARG
jgi:hypothetical protein